MSDLAKIVTKERFLNAFKICQDYCQSNDHILDVNFRLIKNHLLNLSEAQVISYYDKFIQSELVYGLPEIHSCDIVTIPKKSTGVREYRFFTMFSMILYNAIGLTFVDSCSDSINTLNFNKRSVYPFYPTKFVINKSSKSEKDKWEVRNNYKNEYKKYQDTLSEVVIPNTALLQLDLTQYFESIIHEKLIQLVYQYSTKTTQAKNNLDQDSSLVLEFFFEALMCRRFSIPQGRKNFVSDYLGYLYLVPFDMKVEELCKGSSLTFKGMIRYVDDITVVFDNPDNIPSSEIFRSLLEIESKIINWFLNTLGLSINSSKTVRKYIADEAEKEQFIEENKKSTSGIGLDDPEKEEAKNEPEKNNTKVGEKLNVEDTFNKFLKMLEQFKFPENGNFEFEISKEDRELMKVIYDSDIFQKYLLKPGNDEKIGKVITKVEVELTVDYINMLIVLFFIEKESNYLFIHILEDFFKNKFKPDDKRHLHILHVLHAQNSYDKKLINRIIKRNRRKISKDNYGKYLLLFSKTITEAEDHNHLDNNAIYNRLINEFTQNTVYHSNYLFNNPSLYQTFIRLLVKEYGSNKAISDQLKHYVLHRRQKKWDLAFNNFHNIFHEICKTKFSLNDSATVKTILDTANNLSLDDQLTIGKFYNRRNFNLISHPGQKGIPAEKVNDKDLKYFEKKVLPIIAKI